MQHKNFPKFGRDVPEMVFLPDTLETTPDNQLYKEWVIVSKDKEGNIEQYYHWLSYHSKNIKEALQAFLKQPCNCEHIQKNLDKDTEFFIYELKTHTVFNKVATTKDIKEALNESTTQKNCG